nr:transposase (putative), gypsy type [Tanacetum cinerariifolium]
AEGKNAELVRELEDIRAQFSGFQVTNEHLSQQAFADVVSAGIAKGMSEGLKHGVEHGRSQLGLESIEAYDPEAEAKFVAALQSLKDLKFSLLDQLEGLKDAPMDVIMAALYLESDTGGDVLQYIRDLRPSSSQLSIPVYPE